eukprot:3124449-Amphidinium_carterae.1
MRKGSYPGGRRGTCEHKSRTLAHAHTEVRVASIGVVLLLSQNPRYSGQDDITQQISNFWNHQCAPIHDIQRAAFESPEG